MSKEIGRQIKSLREKKGWSQIYVSEKLNIDNTILSKIESGKRGLEVPLLNKFADLFEVSSDYLLGRKEIQKNHNETILFYDTVGLTSEEIEDIKRHIEYIKWKSTQKHENK